MPPLSGAAYTLSAFGYTAEISSVGATLRSLTFAGRDLVRPFGADEMRPAYSGALLAPWPNRVVDGCYEWDGVRHQLALTEPARGHALHGLMAWQYFAAVGVSEDSVTLVADLAAQDGYPFPLSVSVTFTLAADGLTQSVSVLNQGDVDAPYGTGPHPYLVAGPGTVNDWTLSLPASSVATVSEPRLLPTGVVAVADTEFDFRSPHPIGETFIDHAFTALAREDGVATVLVTAPDGTGVGMSWGAECPWVQVHTADGTGRTGLAVEPMTCPPDAFSTGEDVIRLAPGSSHTASWRLFAV